MKCLGCQHENPPQSRFCFECGARLAPTCSSCGTELPAGVKFCNQCGQAAAGQTPTEPRLVSPETYTPKHRHLGLGMLYRLAGTRQQAWEHLTTAVTMFGEMDMRYWREQAEPELKELG